MLLVAELLGLLEGLGAVPPGVAARPQAPLRTLHFQGEGARREEDAEAHPGGGRGAPVGAVDGLAPGKIEKIYSWRGRFLKSDSN